MIKSFRNLFLLLALCGVMVAALTGCEQKPTEPGGDVPEVQGDYRRGVWEDVYKRQFVWSPYFAGGQLELPAGLHGSLLSGAL